MSSTSVFFANSSGRSAARRPRPLAAVALALLAAVVAAPAMPAGPATAVAQQHALPATLDVATLETGATDASGTTLTPAKTTAKSTAKRKSRGAKTLAVLGRPRSGSRWFSGAWTGGYMSGARANAFGKWRGTVLDSVTSYPDKRTWRSIADSEWEIATYDSFPGRLVYGLPLLPSDDGGTLADVAKGKYDWVWRSVAQDLVKHRRGNAVVRLGFEANGNWTRYGVTRSNAATWRAAYRRAATVMTKVAPKLVTDYDITCGFTMPGSRNRLDSLTLAYPGDDVVDVIGCDIYDEWQTKARANAQWRSAIAPRLSPGLNDVAAFARARGKGMSIPEWGVAYPGRGGHGDNPFFITAMRTWMVANADVLVLENYFNDPDPSVRSDLWGGQNRRAAAAYRAKW